jgi:hypothetical protein
MNSTALHASLAVFTGIAAIVLMVLGAVDNDIFQTIIGIANAIMSTINTYTAINNRDK